MRAISQLIKYAHITNNTTGNPVGLVQNLGSGVRDFFYEPLEGMSEGSLEAFLSGLGKGACAVRKATNDDIIFAYLLHTRTPVHNRHQQPAGQHHGGDLHGGL